MRKGLAAPRDLDLEFVGSGFPETLARLRELEALAFTGSGRIDELRREAGVETSSPNPTKAKIIARLSEDESAPAPAPARAPRAKKKPR